MRRTSRTRTVTTVTLTAALALAAVGCTSEEGDPGSNDPVTTPADTTERPGSEPGIPSSTSASSTAPSSTPTPRVTERSVTEPTGTEPPGTEPTPSTGEPTTTRPPSEPADSPASRAHRALLPKATMPGLNQTWEWDRATPGTGEAPPGACLQSSLTAIGGFAEARRDYSSSLSHDADATVLSVVFPDVQTTRAAVSVLAAWQQKCRRHATSELGLERVRVSDVRSVATRVGAGSHWLVTYRPGPQRDSAWFDAEGYVVDGDTLTYVVVRVAGQDYNYQPGEEPIERALVAAGKRLKRTR